MSRTTSTHQVDYLESQALVGDRNWRDDRVPWNANQMQKTIRLMEEYVERVWKPDQVIGPPEITALHDVLVAGIHLYAAEELLRLPLPSTPDALLTWFYDWYSRVQRRWRRVFSAYERHTLEMEAAAKKR